MTQVVLKSWEYFGPRNSLVLVREPVCQVPGDCECILATLARHVDYELRLTYAKAYPNPVLFEDIELVDVEKLSSGFLQSRSRQGGWSISELLKYAKKKDVPLWNESSVVVEYEQDVLATIMGDEVTSPLSTNQKVKVLRNRLKEGTFLGTMVIRSDYPSSSEDKVVYMGLPGKIKETQSVLILGLVELKEHNSYYCSPGYYFQYQDARDPTCTGLLGKGINLASIGVLLAISKAKISLPAVLCAPVPIKMI